jgi:hypothetical protein
MRSVVYDAAVLVAADKNDRRRWADHRVRLEAGIVPMVPAGVVAQVSRSPRQVQLRRFLRGCEVVALDEIGAHRSGTLLGRSGTQDVVDASVVDLAVQRGADVVTGDASDVGRLVAAARASVNIVRT